MKHHRSPRIPVYIRDVWGTHVNLTFHTIDYSFNAKLNIGHYYNPYNGRNKIFSNYEDFTKHYEKHYYKYEEGYSEA